MRQFALDTNVFIDALRSENDGQRLEQFFLVHLPRAWMSVVVMQELRVGARTPRQVKALDRGVLEPFIQRGRILVPTARAFRESGRVVADIAGGRGRSSPPVARGLLNDALLAASCRESGVTLITRDRDFALIARRLPGFEHIAPWPKG